MQLFFSCERELSCEGCLATNKPPTAIAGQDTSLTLPTDSLLLDGSASSDPDGSINEWLWTKISGPVTFTIFDAAATKTVVKNLVSGIYRFELKVTDDSSLAGRDTVQVEVRADTTSVNQPPVACADADQALILPMNTTTLDGGCSYDPDNNITTYLWTKIDGPSSFSITTTTAVKTEVNSLIEGDYLFQLKVTDATGLSSTDTVVISVRKGACDNNQPQVISIPCGSNRPQVNAQLIPIGQLSQPRTDMAVASAGNKIVFAGGVFIDQTSTYQNSSRVDIFDLSTQRWSGAELSVARHIMAATVNGNKIFFGGGEVGDGTIPVATVDVYDVAANSWTVHNLSVPGNDIAAATVGDKVLFAGGDGGVIGRWKRSITVDIYNLSTNTWSTAPLCSEGKKGWHAAVTLNNKVYIAGGEAHGGSWYGSNRIDVYDNATNTWSADFLSQGKLGLSGIAVQNKIYWAGGKTGRYPSSLEITCSVEIKDINAGSSTVQSLSKPIAWSTPVVKDNKILFFGVNNMNPDTNKFDIYDIDTNSWSIGVLPMALSWSASIIAVNNTVYIAGVESNGVISNQVWKLEF